MSTFYDTHAHLDYPDFAADLPQTIDRARAAGITKIISIGTDFESSHRAVQIADRFPGVFAAIGWHPNDATAAPPDVRPVLREWASHPKVVAIGETGLDYFRLPGKNLPESAELDARVKERQADLFRQHLEVAAEKGLSVVIHQRGDCFDDTWSLLQPFTHRVRAVFHCFAGDASMVKRILAVGSVVSFTGILTFKNGQNIREALAATPLDKFMLETDSPFLAPVPYRGKRCEPSYVKEIAEVAAAVGGCSLEELSLATCQTAESIFPKLRTG